MVSPHVADPTGVAPALGLLAAAGPRTAAAPGEYALVVEAVREGYLLHYAAPGARVVRGADGDLALLAGDYLYALGLERLAALGDLAAVRELSDLISLAAQVHDGSPDAGARRARGRGPVARLRDRDRGGHRRRPRAGQGRCARRPRTGRRRALGRRPRAAESGGFEERLGDAAAGLDFRRDHLSSLG